MKLAVVTFTAYNQLHKRAFFEDDILMSYVIKTRIRHMFCKTAIIHKIEWHETNKINEMNYDSVPQLDPENEKQNEMRNENSYEIDISQK